MNKIVFKDAERIVRLTMIVILLTAAASKFFSHGGFLEYYSKLFQGNLRIKLPPFIVNTYLSLIPYIEISLGLALLSNKHKQFTVYGWFALFLSLIVGHYILQEWSSVTEMLSYMFLGLLCMVLPNHQSWLRRDTPSSIV
ncbi:MAG: hypothetical protein HQK88_05380 [Nitrospirae bacterium]|nr:hypothetical protein [Nitrospirota bacterium]MBF0534074.1 hypothetical protein [Nitrospirota bacterium]MBF0616233.1 hypothetical protein [Nitrospirota bacterium]